MKHLGNYGYVEVNETEHELRRCISADSSNFLFTPNYHKSIQRFADFIANRHATRNDDNQWIQIFLNHAPMALRLNDFSRGV